MVRGHRDARWLTDQWPDGTLLRRWQLLATAATRLYVLVVHRPLVRPLSRVFP